ncbi:MFS transporter [Streptomyces sp. NPDC001262]|uniref:MFS transporter n=1 Tax=unclassified Streptomyces TaxID=2593676 RepID=UPI0036B2401C
MDQLVSSPVAAAAGRRTAGSGTLIASLVLAVVACQLCISMPTPALPDIADRLSVSTAAVGFAQALFFLLGGLLSVVVSAYSDHSDSRRLMTWALVVMCIGSAVVTAAPGFGVFVVGRLLQSASAVVFPVALRVMRQKLSAREFGRAMGLITAANGGIVGLDGLLSGRLTDAFGFRAVFAVMTVFGVATVFAVRTLVPSFAGTATGRMDWAGVLTLSAGLGAVELGIGAAGRAGPVAVVSLLVLGAVLFAAFCLLEKRSAHPLIPVAYLRSRRTWPVLLTSVLTTAGLLGVVNYVVPMLSQHHGSGFGMTATVSALLFIVPMCLVNVVFAPVAGSLAPRVGWRRMLRYALLFSVPALMVLAVGIRSRWLVFAMVLVIGFGLAGALTPLNGLSALLAPQDSPTVLPGVNSACYGVGSSLGIAMSSSLIGGKSTAGFQSAVWAAAGAVALAFLVSLLIAGNGDGREGRTR